MSALFTRLQIMRMCVKYPSLFVIGRYDILLLEGGVGVALAVEIRERQKDKLSILLRIKKANDGIEVNGLKEEIIQALAVMEEADVVWVEKVIGVKAM